MNWTTEVPTKVGLYVHKFYGSLKWGVGEAQYEVNMATVKDIEWFKDFKRMATVSHRKFYGPIESPEEEG